MTGVAQVQARIVEIQAQLTTLAPGRSTGSTTSGTAFADELARAAAANATGKSAGTTTVDGPRAAGSAGGPTGTDVVAAARKYLGVPYVFGGTNPKTGLDCSGLVQRVFADLGVKLPRMVRHQMLQGEAVRSLAQAKPGDLLIFDGHQHIGIYLGGGKMLHAPQPGERVKIGKVYETPTSIRRIVPPTASNGMDASAAVRPSALSGRSLGANVPYADLFVAAGRRHGVSPALLAAVAKVESGYNPHAVSPAGARGLMQIMPGTARGLGVDPMNPAQAVDGAARLLAGNLKKFGSVELALAAYNAGGGAVTKYGGIPPYAETQAYVPKVLNAMRRIEGH